LSLETDQSAQTWIYALGIFRALILLEPEFISDDLSTLVFQLFAKRVFNLVTSFRGAHFDLETFNYPQKAFLFRETAKNYKYLDETQGIQMRGIYTQPPLSKNALSCLMNIIDIPLTPAKAK